MKVSSDDHLEGARLLSRFSMQICIISGYFLGTLTENGPIRWEGKRLICLLLFGTLWYFFGTFYTILVLFWYFFGTFLVIII